MLHERTIPFGTLISYLLLYFAAFAVQMILFYGFGFSTENQDQLIRLGSLSNLIGYGVGFLSLYILYFKYLKFKIKDSLKNYSRTLIYVVGGFVALYALSILVTLIYNLIGLTSIPDNQEQLNAIANAAVFDKWALAIYAVILAPFVEEMVFRLGIITLIRNLFVNSKLNQKAIAAIAIIISSLLFGYIHVTGDIEQIGNYAALGVILGYVYYKTDNIYTSIFVHMVYNGLAAYVMFAG
jgi:hypothetical protein